MGTNHNFLFSSSIQGIANSAFASNHEKSTFSTPAISRKSSSRSYVRKVSPSQSRRSSISFHPDSTNLRRIKTYDQPEVPQPVNGMTVSEQDISVAQESGQKSPGVVSSGQFDEIYLGKAINLLLFVCYL